jgi:hypothetical protein
MQLGWHTRSFPDLKVFLTGRQVLLRVRGRIHQEWPGRLHFGLPPVFMAAKCGRRLFERPHRRRNWRGIWILTGYLRRIPQVDDRELIRYLRRQQMRRMFRMASIWK